MYIFSRRGFPLVHECFGRTGPLIRRSNIVAIDTVARTCASPVSNKHDDKGSLGAYACFL